MNQVIEVPDISVVSVVGGVKQLKSIREQKVKKGTLQTFGTGSGVKYGDDLFVLNNPAIVTMKTEKQSVAFYCTWINSITVDWGDGTKERNVFSHNYASAVEHEIRFYGNETCLQELNCYRMQLTTLDVSKNIDLMRLVCFDNQLITLDVSKNIALMYLSCSGNPMITNQAYITAMANTLVDRSGTTSGELLINDVTSKGWIQSICTAKNWTVS